MSYSELEISIANQMGHSPEEVYGERKSFSDADSSAEDLLNLDIPEMPEEPAKDETSPEDIKVEETLETPDQEQEDKDIKAKLTVIIDDENASESDKKTAQELLAAIEELEAAEKNAQDFLDEMDKKAKPEEKTAEETPAEEKPTEEKPAEEMPAV